MSDRHERRRQLRVEAARRGVPPGNETERWVRLKLIKLEAQDNAELSRIFDDPTSDDRNERSSFF